MKLLTRYRWHQARVFGLTWIAFFMFAIVRLPAAITKSALNPHVTVPVNQTALVMSQSINESIDQLMYSSGNTLISTSQWSMGQWTNSSLLDESEVIERAGWYPFNDPDTGVRDLGMLDTSYLVSFAVCLFVIAPLGDRIPLRWFLGFGLLMSGFLAIINGLFYYWHVRQLWAWCLLNGLFGISQSTGWPGCIAAMSNWFGRKRIGFTIGIWATHVTAGSLCGKYIGSLLQSKFGWQWNFLGIGIAVVLSSFTQMAWLITAPHDVFTPAELDEIEQEQVKEDVEKEAKKEAKRQTKSNDLNQSLLLDDHQSINADLKFNGEDHHSIEHPTGRLDYIPNLSDHVHQTIDVDDHDPLVEQSLGPHDPSIHEPVSYLRAMRVPGVLECGISLTFSKLILYAMGLWLPFYLTEHLGYSQSEAASLSTASDYGGVLSGIFVGLLSDFVGKRGFLTFVLSLLSIPLFYLYTTYGSVSTVANAAMLFFIGMIAYGPTVLIAGSMTSELGSHPSLKGNLHARSTITGVIDGFGSIGACFTGTLVSSLSSRWGWDSVYYTYMVLAFITSVVMCRVAYREFRPVKYDYDQSINQSINQSVCHGKDETHSITGIVVAPSKLS